MSNLNSAWTSPSTNDPAVAQPNVNNISDIIDVVAATGLTLDIIGNFKVIQVRSSGGGDTTITASPPIELPADTQDGRILEIWGTDDTRTVTFTSGTGLNLKTSTLTLGNNDALFLRYFADDSEWKEQDYSRSTNGTVSGYTPSNGTTDRTFDADSITLHELADVVATLIDDLQA